MLTSIHYFRWVFNFVTYFFSSEIFILKWETIFTKNCYEKQADRSLWLFLLLLLPDNVDTISDQWISFLH